MTDSAPAKPKDSSSHESAEVGDAHSANRTPTRRALRRLNWRYALGELVIVVLGIMIAFQIDRWNTGTKEAEIAQAYLDRLVSDLAADVRTLRENVELSLGRMEEADRILVWMNRRATPPSRDSLVRAIFITRGSHILPTRVSTYADLVSSGALTLIEDLTLRDAIVTYYESVPLSLDQEGDWVSRVNFPVWESIGRHVDDRVIFGPSDRQADYPLFVTSWEEFAADSELKRRLRLWSPASYNTSDWLGGLVGQAESLRSMVVAAGGTPQP